MGIIPNLLEPSQKQVALYLCTAHIILACSTLGSCHAKGHCRKCSIGPVFGQILSCTSYGNCENDWTPRAQGMKTRKKNHEVNFLNVQKNITELDPMRSQVTGWRCCPLKTMILSPRSSWWRIKNLGCELCSRQGRDGSRPDPAEVWTHKSSACWDYMSTGIAEGSRAWNLSVAMAKGQPNHGEKQW